MPLWYVEVMGVDWDAWSFEMNLLCPLCCVGEMVREWNEWFFDVPNNR